MAVGKTALRTFCYIGESWYTGFLQIVADEVKRSKTLA